MTKKDLHNITQKTNDITTRTPLKTGVELSCSGRVSSSCSTSGLGAEDWVRWKNVLVLTLQRYVLMPGAGNYSTALQYYKPCVYIFFI